MPAAPADVCRRLTNGIYVVTAREGRRRGGFTAAWVTQVSFDPLLLALSINPSNATWALIEQSRRFAVNVLASGELETARQFGLRSGRDVDKLAGVAVHEVPPVEGFVVLADAVAWAGCRVEQQVPAGDHIVLVARVVAGDVPDPQAVPLRYSDTGTMDGSTALYPARFPADS